MKARLRRAELPGPISICGGASRASVAYMQTFPATEPEPPTASVLPSNDQASARPVPQCAIQASDAICAVLLTLIAGRLASARRGGRVGVGDGTGVGVSSTGAGCRLLATTNTTPTINN